MNDQEILNFLKILNDLYHEKHPIDSPMIPPVSELVIFALQEKIISESEVEEIFEPIRKLNLTRKELKKKLKVLRVSLLPK